MFGCSADDVEVVELRTDGSDTNVEYKVTIEEAQIERSVVDTAVEENKEAIQDALGGTEVCAHATQ